jgi:hypothetical protein
MDTTCVSIVQLKVAFYDRREARDHGQQLLRNYGDAVAKTRAATRF